MTAKFRLTLVWSAACLVPLPAAAANLAPVFNVATNRHVINGGMTIAITNTATDADMPGQSLSYSLLSAPLGATINTGNGVVTWDTTTNNAGSSNFFRVVVADNGTPPLSATKSFTVFVRPSKPNIVIIVTDDHGFGDISAHGCPAPTPNMDRLGNEGIRLERFYATPVCSVTRSAFLTGRNPLRTQVNNTRGLDLDEHTLPQTFKAAGYQTFMCGKWHLGGLYNTETNTVINGIAVPVIRENVEYQPQNRGWDVHYGEYTGAINYTTHVSQETRQADWWLNGQPKSDAGWSTDLLADKAVQLLQQRDPTKPVVLYLAFNAVHGPVSAPANYLAKYAGVATGNRRSTLAAIDQMDVAIGRVLNAIDAEGIATNTLVAFFGDNGGQSSTGGSNLPLRGDKGDLFDGGIHTPAAIRWPGVLPSGVTNCQQFVWVGDFFPTLCAAVGVTPLNTKPFDGANVWPLLLNATNGPFNPVNYRGVPLVSGSSAGSGVFDVFSNGTSLTMFKLIRDRLPGGGGGFTNLGLFDIIADPFETNDLLAVPDFVGVVATLSTNHDAIRPESYSPYIGVHPQSQTVSAGSNVTLWAMTTVYPRQLTCQWRRNGVNIPGATNRVTVDTSVYLTRLDLANVSALDAATYDVVVTDNAVGWPTTVVSQPAQLLVNGDVGPTNNAVGFDVLLGRPTDTSIAASVLSSNDLQMYFEYGGQPGVYTNTTPLFGVIAGLPTVATMHQLESNRRYFYRARYSTTGIAPFEIGPERTFHTQRARGSKFTFVIEADPHNRDNEPPVWRLALTNMLTDTPDFLIDLGDTFVDEKVAVTNAYFLTKPGIFDLHQEVRAAFFSILGHSVPTFLVNGNHEAELGWLLSGTSNPGVWGAQARQHYFPVPVPGGFYSGATNSDPHTLGPRDGYYAFEWGDALFVVLDPYWYTSPKPQQNGWSWTLGAQQYFWLERTLERSTARFKFVFAHHLIGGGLGNQSRGGLTYAPYFEWGGYNADGSYGFTTQRPGWPAPIQDLLLANGVQLFFHGHDHLFVKEDLDANHDGIPELIYQEVPQPSRTLAGTNSAAGYGYTNSLVIGNSGHLRVTISPTNAHVEYVRVYLPANEGAGRTNRMVSYSYNIAPTERWSMWKLPDTGQTNRHATPVSGVDADYTLNAPAFTNNGDGTTTDLVTGLTWQRVDGGEMTWPNVGTYAATNTLGGVPAGTWRLPTIHELASLMVYYRENPALNTDHFLPSGGNADYWWSCDRLATDSTRIWCANAGGGVGPKPQTETLSAGGPFRYHTRLVRGPSAPTNSPMHRFFNNSNGTVTDLDTGLTWQQGEAQALMSWTNALLYAESLTLAGFTDWRLPNIKELESLNDETLTSPSVDANFFPAAKSARYWSSTTQNNRATNAWFAEFITGITSQSAKVGSNWVRAVRGPDALAAPVLALATNLPGASARLMVGGEAGRLYTIQASMDFANWVNLLTTNPPVTPFVWSDVGPAHPWRFYRAVLEP